jgi:toxin ParE1/3/4
VREVLWSEAALEDLDSALAYIASDNPAAAVKVLRRIDETAAGLGRIPSGRRGRVAGTYEKSVTRLPYIIAYSFQSAPGGGERIVILRVIHSARNWPQGAWPKDRDSSLE